MNGSAEKPLFCVSWIGFFCYQPFAIKFLELVCFKVFFTVADHSDADESLLLTNILFKYFHLSNFIFYAIDNGPHLHLVYLDVKQICY